MLIQRSGAGNLLSVGLLAAVWTDSQIVANRTRTWPARWAGEWGQQASAAQLQGGDESTSDLWHTVSGLQAVEKLSGECETRQNLAKKRSLHAVNEHFEPDFNAVSCRLRVFQQPARE